jgi:glutamate--cysteine ligase catalytic subunit
LLFAGLLKVGIPKSWDDSKNNLRYIRRAGVRQFISTYNRVKDLKGDELLWGDEIEYGIFKLDHESKKVRISLRGKEVRLFLSTVIAGVSPCCWYTMMMMYRNLTS